MRKLSPEQIEQIRSATEDLLENVGLQVQHESLLQRARAAGARVDEADGTVRIPAPLLRDLVAQAPSAYEIADLAGNAFTLQQGSLGCMAIVTDPWIIDYETQLPRRPCLADIRRHTIIAQRLAPVVGISRMDFPVTDVEGPTSSLRALESHLLHHAKHNVVLPTSPESLEQWLGILEILSQGRDPAGTRLVTLGVPTLSPLRLTQMNGELLIRGCEWGMPILPTCCPMAGTTGPYSKIGLLLLGNAENVFLAALTQILRPGHPFMYALGTSRTDMRSGSDMYYTIDKVLWKLAAAQMGHAYGLPVSSECGGTMTYRYDQQNGAEGMLFMLSAYESEAAILAGIGSCYNANGMSAEMMVIQAEWLAAARFLSRGIETDTLEIAMESIKRVGPGGHYLMDELTLENLRSHEFFDAEILDHTGHYGPYPALLARAHEKVEALVADYESPVPGQIQEELRRYFHDLYQQVA